MTLQERLDAHKARFQAKAPKDILEIMRRATDNLRHSGILSGTAKVGDEALEFILPDVTGKPLSSSALLMKGPLVLSFYRGKW